MNLELISLIGIVIGLLVLTYLVFKGVSLLIAAPVVSIIILIISGQPIIENISGAYFSAMGNFFGKNMFLFMMGGVFGSIMGECGAAEDIAHFLTGAIDRIHLKNKKFLSLMILTFVFMGMNYGGIGGMVIVFTMFPICLYVFKEYDIPWHLYMGVHAFGTLITQTMIPGAPAVQNLIPIEYLGTTPMAAPFMGLATGLMCVPFGMGYIGYQLRKAQKKGEGFMVSGAEVNISEKEKKEVKCTNGSFLKAILPSGLVFVLLNVFHMESYAALTIGSLFCAVIYYKKFESASHIIRCFSKSGGNGAAIAAACAGMVGMGGIVTAVPGYQLLVNGLTSIPTSPLVQLVIATNIIAGMSGSGSAGEGIALQTFGSQFLALGYPAEVIHRIVGIAALGLDSLPHNGSILMQLELTKIKFRDGYKHVFWIGAMIPFFAGFFAVFCYYAGII